MSKKVFFVLGIMILLAACGKESKNEVIKIGISQIVDHPSLDQIRQGIIDGLEKEGYKDGDNIRINFQNAQGEMSNAQLIARNFDESEDLIVAITTPSAQASLNASREKAIFFSAVTDPISAGLIGENITGTSDATPIEKQIELAIKLLGEIDNIGIIYNIGEANSQVQVDRVKELEEKYSFKLKLIGINSLNEISQGLDSLLGQIDLLYTPIDNLLASSYPLIVRKANEKNIPILGAVDEFERKGAFATEGINQYNIGIQTANMIVKYLRDKVKLADMPFETVENTDLVINKSVLEAMGISLSEDLKNRAILVN